MQKYKKSVIRRKRQMKVKGETVMDHSTCDTNNCITVKDYENAKELRQSYRRYLGLYGLQVAALALLPCMYLINTGPLIKYLDEGYYSFGGIVLTFIVCIILVASVRLFGFQTNLNIYYVKSQQVIREKFFNFKNCSMCENPLLGIGIKPLRTEGGELSIPKHVTRGYYDACLGIYWLALILMFLSFPYYVKLVKYLITTMGVELFLFFSQEGTVITPYKYNFVFYYLYSISLFCFVFGIWFKITLPHIAAAYQHLLTANAIIQENPVPNFPPKLYLPHSKKGQKDISWLTYKYLIWLPFLLCLSLIYYKNYLINSFSFDNALKFFIFLFIFILLGLFLATIRQAYYVYMFNSIYGKVLLWKSLWQIGDSAIKAEVKYLSQKKMDSLIKKHSRTPINIFKNSNLKFLKLTKLGRIGLGVKMSAAILQELNYLLEQLENGFKNVLDFPSQQTLKMARKKAKQMT